MSQYEFVTAAEAAALLCCSKKMVYKLFAQGELLGVKIGALVRIRRSSIDAYLVAHANVKPAPSTGIPVDAKPRRRRKTDATEFRFLAPR